MHALMVEFCAAQAQAAQAAAAERAAATSGATDSGQTSTSEEDDSDERSGAAGASGQAAQAALEYAAQLQSDVFAQGLLSPGGMRPSDQALLLSNLRNMQFQLTGQVRASGLALQRMQGLQRGARGCARGVLLLRH